MAVYETDYWLSGLMPADIVYHHLDGRFRLGHAGYVRGEQHSSMHTQRMIGRQGFRIGDVENCAGKPATVERDEKIGLHQMAATPAVDDRRAGREFGE